MKKLLYLLFVSNLFFYSCTNNHNSTIIELKNNYFKTSINSKGIFDSFTNIKTEKNYLAKNISSPLLSIRVNNKVIAPISAITKEDTIILTFGNNIKAFIKTKNKASHFTFELVSLTNSDSVELIIWGPYSTVINKIIGETVGVVRDEDFAIGIQSLNIKTLGGYPWNESDRMPAFDIFSENNPDDMYPKNDGSVLYRVEAAKPTKTGSSLQAYCRNRNTDRIVSDFNHEKIVAPAYDDGGLIGSKIALFGCPVNNALEFIGKIELTENLVHPTINGEWVKTYPKTSASYIIMSFSEDDIDNAIAITQKAGLEYLYYYGKTFKSWGHFNLAEQQFPDGYKTMKKFVEKANKKGIKLGTHILSNFITTNDAYVSPIPDKRLAKVGSSVIVENIDSTQTEIIIKSPVFFKQMKNNNLKTVMIDNELIRYGRVSEKKPWTLLDCQRGAFNTVVSNHTAKTKISKLLDHPYKVFLTNANLTIEVSKNIAKLYNETGLRQISFDGLEGNRSTGLGTYGESLMPYTWYNSLINKNDLIIDASRTTHFFWHLYSRMNWGEPWHGDFRESQTEYRLKNQAYFQRNFMPGMLGWFKMTDETSIEDIEWLLARSAGFDAGFAFITSFDVLAKNGNSDKILEQIATWEKLRLSNAFTDEQKELMKNTKNEFSLIKIKDNEWELTRVYTNRFKHNSKTLQPGEPLYSTFNFENKGREQTLNFILSAIDSDISEIIIELNNYKEIQIPIKLLRNQTLKYTGGNKAIVFDKQWHIINEIDINPVDFKVQKGKQTLTFDCRFTNKKENPHIKLELRIYGAPENVVVH